MAIDFYGMPMLPTSYGVQTLFNLVEQGSEGGEAIILDPDIAAKMYQMVDIEEDKYNQLSALARKEMDIKRPEDAEVASSLAITGNWLAGACSAIVDAIGDVIQFACDIVATVVENVASGVSNIAGGLFKGLGPLALVAGGVILFFFLK